MIKLVNLNKYFNKRKKNEIHVINNTSLELPDKGIVFLFGASGSGKTTLLNVIGGLDQAKGEIIYNNIDINRFSKRKVDAFRRKEIGYIFQNYYLLNDKTVYENLKFALNLVDIYDEEEINRRIDYCLDAVGMLNYKKRLASALSGGQQQRVAIARALVKKAKVIIADEPTGNLDSNNSLEIMNVLKKISLNCLVILVSHDRKLATFFADRIIELKDGKVINDYINENQDAYQKDDGNVIYLKNLKQEQISDDNINLNLYYDEEVKTPQKIELVYKDGVLLVKVNTSSKVRFLSKKDDIILKDAYSEVITKDNLIDHQFDTSFFQDKHGKHKLYPIILDNLNVAFKNFFKVKLKTKFLYVTFFIMGILIAYSFAQISEIYSASSNKYQTNDESYVYVNNDGYSKVDFKTLLNHESIYNCDYQLFGLDPIIRLSFSYQTDNLFMRFSSAIRASNSNYKIEAIPTKVIGNNPQVIIGKLPTKMNEIAISDTMAKMLIEFYEPTGLDAFQDIVGKEVVLNDNYIITGIIRRDAAILVLNEEAYIYLIYSNKFSSIYDLYNEDKYQLVEGRKIEQKGEILVPKDANVNIGDIIDSYNDYNLFSQFKVVGKFETKGVNLSFHKTTLIISIDDIKDYLLFSLPQYPLDFGLYSKNKDETIKYLRSLNLEGIDAYKKAKETYQGNKIEEASVQVAYLTFYLIAITIFIFFIMRARMINRIYTVGVYRALGASRMKIYSLFLFEILILATLTTLAGYYVTVYLIDYTNSLLQGVYNINFTLINIILGNLFIYLVFIVSGLLPVFLLIRKTPAAILTKYDI